MATSTSHYPTVDEHPVLGAQNKVETSDDFRKKTRLNDDNGELEQCPVTAWEKAPGSPNDHTAGSYRSLYIEQIPADMSAYDVLCHLGRGVVVDIKMPYTTASPHAEYMLATFVVQRDALQCMAETCERLSTLHDLQGDRLSMFKLGFQPVMAYPLHGDVVDMVYAGVLSRILEIKNLPAIDHAQLASLLSITGSRFHGIIAIEDVSSGYVHIHTTSIDNAVRCYHKAKRETLLRDSDVGFLPDPSLRTPVQPKENRREVLEHFFATHDRYREGNTRDYRRPFVPNPRTRPFRPVPPAQPVPAPPATFSQAPTAVPHAPAALPHARAAYAQAPAAVTHAHAAVYQAPAAVRHAPAATAFAPAAAPYAPAYAPHAPVAVPVNPAAPPEASGNGTESEESEEESDSDEPLINLLDDDDDDDTLWQPAPSPLVKPLTRDMEALVPHQAWTIMDAMEVNMIDMDDAVEGDMIDMDEVEGDMIDMDEEGDMIELEA